MWRCSRGNKVRRATLTDIQTTYTRAIVTGCYDLCSVTWQQCGEDSGIVAASIWLILYLQKSTLDHLKSLAPTFTWFKSTLFRYCLGHWKGTFAGLESKKEVTRMKEILLVLKIPPLLLPGMLLSSPSYTYCLLRVCWTVCLRKYILHFWNSWIISNLQHYINNKRSSCSFILLFFSLLTLPLCPSVYIPEFEGSTMNTGLELGLCLSPGKARLWWRRICAALTNNFIERGQMMSALRLLCRLEADAEEEVC